MTPTDNHPQGDSAQRPRHHRWRQNEHHQRFGCCPYCRRDAAKGNTPCGGPSWLHPCRCQLCRWPVLRLGQQPDGWAGGACDQACAMQGGIPNMYAYESAGATYPHGCHVVEIELILPPALPRSNATPWLTILASSSTRLPCAARFMAALRRASARHL